MNKCIVLILTVIVIIVNSNEENDTGIEAFKKAYYNLSKRAVGHKKTDLLEKYYNELFSSAIEGLQERILLPPRKWCNNTFLNGENCMNNLRAAGYKRLASGMDVDMKSFEAFKYSYFTTYYDIVKRKSMFARKYFEDLYNTNKHLLHTNDLRSPKEFCESIISTGQPLMNPSQEQNQYTGEGSSRQVFGPFGGVNQIIDLNLPYDDGNMNENNDEGFGQIKNAEEESNRNFDLNV